MRFQKFEKLLSVHNRAFDGGDFIVKRNFEFSQQMTLNKVLKDRNCKSDVDDWFAMWWSYFNGWVQIYSGTNIIHKLEDQTEKRD